MCENKPMENLVYFLDGKTYINITNACTNACLFCIRNIKDDVKGANLWLKNDDTKAEDVILQLEKFKDKIGEEITFCGYGEPLLRVDEVKKVAEYVKENMKNVKKIRINTNGHASLVKGHDVLPDLKGLIDEISISLNAQNEKLYNEISKPKIKGAYFAMLDFAKKAVKYGFKVSMTIVTDFEDFKIDEKACRKIAENIGANFRARKYEQNGY